MIDGGTSMRVDTLVRDFIDNVRSTRRSKIVGIDKKLLSQRETLDIIVKYFKANNNSFQELIKFKINKDV